MEQGRGDVGAGEAFFEQAFDEVILAFEVTVFQSGAEFVEEDVGAGFLHFVLGGRFAVVHFHLGIAFDGIDLKEFATGGEGDGAATAAGAAGAADAVKVVLDVVREIVIEDDLDIVHVNAAGGDVGGDKEFEAGLAEFAHDAVAHGLAHVAVEAVGGVTLGVKMINEFVHHALGVAENDAELEVVDINEAGEEFDFVAAIHFVINLLDGWDGEGGLLDADILGIARIILDQLLDGARQGGGKENGLAFFRHGLKDEFDIVAEAHVEHDVGFVEDDHFDFVEAQGAAAHMVHNAAGSADDDLGALLEAEELAFVGLAAVNGEGVDAALEEGEFVDFFGDLDGEFASGAEDNDLDGAERRVHFLDGGDSEGRGLAGARLGLADDISTGKEHGDGFGLNGRSLLEAEFINGLEQFGGNAQFGK
jgi:hypothetical protein